MSEVLTFFVGNRNPSITENIVDTNGPVDLSSSTVKFKAREAGSDTLLVDAAAVVVAPGTDGNVRYDWSAADIGSTGILFQERLCLVWWEVTTAGKTQDVMEAIIEVRDHAPGQLYVEPEELKATLELLGTSYADLDVRRSVVAASRAIDEICGRRFWLDSDANHVRYYQGCGDRVWVDDIVEVTSVEVDTNGDGSFGSAWTENDDYLLAPLNAAADGWPWTRLEVHPNSGSYFPHYPRSVKVTGQFGWSTVPEAIKAATGILAERVMVRMRQAPLGVQQFGLDGEAVQIARTDPDVAMLVAPYVRVKA